MQMDKKERAKILNTLNRQKNRLKAKGANAEEIKDYLGFYPGDELGKMSDFQLKALRDKKQKAPRVTVIGGNIYPTSYISKFIVWNTKNSTRPLASGYKKALQTNFMTQDKTIKDTKKRKRDFDRSAQNLYVQRLRDVGANKIADKIAKMRSERFYKMLSSGKGVIDFERIAYFDKMLERLERYEDKEAEIESLIHDVTKAYNSFISAERRR